MILKHTVSVTASPKTVCFLSTLLGRKVRRGEIVVLDAATLVASGFKHFTFDIFAACDCCGDFYRYCSRKIDSDKYCGKCRLERAREKMVITKRTDEIRYKHRMLMSDLLEKGRDAYVQRVRDGWLRYWNSLTDNEKQMHLHRSVFSIKPEQRKRGDQHHNFNPNKTEYAAYRYVVQRVTKKQDLSSLENYGKPLTMSGVDGGYQIDHMLSVFDGFKMGITPEVIGSIHNLRIIPWEENNSKRANSIMSADDLLKKVEGTASKY